MRVGLLVTCLVDGMFPAVGRSTVTLLRRLGCVTDVPSTQTCCGQMHINSGYPDLVAPMARRLVDTFENFDAVVVPSGSCAGSVRHQIAGATNDPRLARRLERIAARTHELSEFLVDVLGVTDVGASYSHRVTFHPTCHAARLLRVGDKPLRLLRAVRGLDLVELEEADSCCGFGGTFALKNAAVSAAIMAAKVRHVMATGADAIVAADSSCLMHMGGGLSRQRAAMKTVHLAEILASTG